MFSQLEFDFVSPYLAEPGPEELHMLQEANKFLSKGEQLLVLRKLAAELHFQGLQFDRNPTNELEELRVLIGSSAWKKSQHQWRRRMRQNPSRVRKVILCMRALYELSAIKTNEQ